VTRLFVRSVPIGMSLLGVLLLLSCRVGQAQSSTSTSDGANKKEMTVRRFYEDCLNRRQVEFIPDLVASGVISHFNDKDEVGIEAFTRAVQRAAGMFPDGQFVIEDIVASGNKVAAHWHMTATNSVPIAGNPATGRKITERAVVFYRFEGEKIAEVWLQVDQIGLFRQLGLKDVPISGPSQVAAPSSH
jgi:steroid delta-isomerase-like uncharacterized protein